MSSVDKPSAVTTGGPTRHIAIIGSGPAGCYLADHLLRLLPDCAIDIVERLPVPFGLVRYGVAPDHQPTKAVARVLDRVLSRDRVRFFGNVEVGRDVRLEELHGMYDAVVIATGAPRDRRLGIPGEDLEGVIGSGAFVGWYNAHPDHAAPTLKDVRSAVILGNGNVALDVARVLAKSAQSQDELNGSDVLAEVASLLAAQPLETIHIVGRRSAADAKFSPHELEELGTLQCATPEVADLASLAGTSPVLDVLRGFAAKNADQNACAAPVKIVFHFGLTPLAFRGQEGRLSAIVFRHAHGGEVEIAAQLAVTCIGYESAPCCTLAPENGIFANTNGKIAAGLYVVGWAKRGPSGTIPTNRTEAQQVAQQMASEVASSDRRGGVALRELLAERGVSWVDYAGWRRIDEAELACGDEQRCRRKLKGIKELLETAGNRSASEALSG